MNCISPALLVFDIDGTLFQTQLVTVPAVQRTFEEYGLPAPEAAEVCAFFGKPVADYEAWLAAQCPEGMAATIVEATNRNELRLIGESGELYPSVRPVLEQLHSDGYTLAICSNGPEDYVAEFVRAHGLTRFFFTVLARGNRYSGKEEMVGLVLDASSVRPLVVIGDRQDDIEAAHAHGGLSVAATYGFGAEHELRGANAAMRRFDELPGILDSLLA